MASPLRYILVPEDCNGHYFTLHIEIPATQAPHHTLVIPSWIPGSYLIRDFAQHISDCHAYDDTHTPCPIRRVQKDTYYIDTQEAVTVSYRLYAWQWCVRGALLDQYIGFFNPIFCFEVIHYDGPILFDCLHTPPTQHWTIATALPYARPSDDKGHYFYADNYHMLIDHPLLMGDNLTQLHFRVQNIPHTFSMNHDQTWPLDQERFSQDLQAITSAHHAIFPQTEMPHYHFLGIIHEHAQGGLEHRNSTALIFQQDQLPLTTQTQRSDRYLALLNLCSHEYFHLWWVKRLRPEAFKHYQLEKEQYTPLLGIFEGFASYYEKQALLKAQLIQPDDYCHTIALIINRLNLSEGDRHESLAEASQMAWIHHYRPNENTHNVRTNYYLKGHLLALQLDISIIRGTDGRVRLSNALQELWHMYQQEGQLVTEDRLANSIQQTSGLDLRDILHQGLHLRAPIDLQEDLSAIGLSLQLVAQTLNERALGITGHQEKHLYCIDAIDHQSWAHQAGFAHGDELIAINELKISPSTFSYALSMSKGTLSCHFFRQGRLRQLSYPLISPHRSEWICQPILMLDPAIRHRQSLFFYSKPPLSSAIAHHNDVIMNPSSL